MLPEQGADYGAGSHEGLLVGQRDILAGTYGPDGWEHTAVTHRSRHCHSEVIARHCILQSLLSGGSLDAEGASASRS